MKIKTNEEMTLFENAIDRCRRSVYLVTSDGRQYDLKTPAGRYQGISQMFEDHRTQTEPELFTNCIEDEMIMFDYFRSCRLLAG